MKYRKKVYDVEAYQWFEGDDPKDIDLVDKSYRIGDMLFVGSLKQPDLKYVCSGDFIVTMPSGELRCYSASRFEELFEKVPEKKKKTTKKDTK